MSDKGLRRGDAVEVLSPAEILATLDERGMLGGLPFMPEMLPFCGQRFVVERRAAKICDTMVGTRSRQIPDTVLLEDLRCNGLGHGGCQAECRLFWKEAWLRRVDSSQVAPIPTTQTGAAALARLVDQQAVQPPGAGTPSAERRYTCQATEHHRASVPLRTWDPRPYVREYMSGNVGFWTFLAVVARAVVHEPLLRLGFRGAFPEHGPHTQPVSLTPLNLQPGDRVQVKTRAEIAATLTQSGVNHGVWFDDENLPFCGGTFRVRQRVTHLIDEHTGRMLDLTDEWVSLEGVVCSGQHSLGRWFCPRAFPVQWTEDWLRRADSQPDA